jgi:murein DD-endopeptidase MepM/ murein hydrolase activator NlpD
MAVAKRFFLCLGMVAVSMTLPSNASADTEIGSPVREGRISSLFGMREDPFEGEQRFHAGIDIAAPVGTPVRPVAAGRVIFSGSYQGFGRIVAIQHGKHMSSLYAHFEELSVTVGQLVDRGTVLGVVGSSGRATGPHLHFEVRVAGTPVDPAWIF